MNHTKLLTLCVLFLSAPLLAKTWIPDSQWQGIMDDAAKRFQLSGNSAMSHHGKIVASGAYGLANRATGEKHTTDTRLRVGSVSKQFVAAAILQLEEKGLLSVNDPIGKYFPNFPAQVRNITIHQMLSNRTGIQDYAHVGHDDTYPHSRIEMLELFYKLPLLFTPGARYAYSSSNFFILGYLVETLTKLQYDDYLKRYIYDVAGMTSTKLEWPKNPTPGYAIGYMPSLIGRDTPAPFVDSSFAFAAGAIGSTTEDLVRWGHALATGKIINQASMKKMGTDYGGGSNYGYAFWVSNKVGHRLWAHGGRISGFCADIRVFPDDDVVIATLENLERWMPEKMDGDMVNSLLQ